MLGCLMRCGGLALEFLKWTMMGEYRGSWAPKRGTCRSLRPWQMLGRCWKQRATMDERLCAQLPSRVTRMLSTPFYVARTSTSTTEMLTVCQHFTCWPWTTVCRWPLCCWTTEQTSKDATLRDAPRSTSPPGRVITRWSSCFWVGERTRTRSTTTVERPSSRPPGRDGTRSSGCSSRTVQQLTTRATRVQRRCASRLRRDTTRWLVSSYNTEQIQVMLISADGLRSASHPRAAIPVLYASSKNTPAVLR